MDNYVITFEKENDSLEKDVKQYAQDNEINDQIELIEKLESLPVVFVRCTEQAKEQLAKMPKVLAVEPDQEIGIL